MGKFRFEIKKQLKIILYSITNQGVVVAKGHYSDK